MGLNRFFQCIWVCLTKENVCLEKKNSLFPLGALWKIVLALRTINLVCLSKLSLSSVTGNSGTNLDWLANFLHHTGYLYRGRSNGSEREENEGDQWGLQEVQRKRVVQKERRHARGTLPLRPKFFFCDTCQSVLSCKKKWSKRKFVFGQLKLFVYFVKFPKAKLSDFL